MTLELGYRDHLGKTILYVRCGSQQARHLDELEFIQELLEIIQDETHEGTPHGQCWAATGEWVRPFEPSHIVYMQDNDYFMGDRPYEPQPTP